MISPAMKRERQHDDDEDELGETNLYNFVVTWMKAGVTRG